MSNKQQSDVVYWDKEHIYDEKLSPLMSQIIEICKEHAIPVVARFQFCHRDDEQGPGYCTTILPGENQSEEMRQLALRMKPNRATAFAITIATNDDGSKKTTVQKVN